MTRHLLFTVVAAVIGSAFQHGYNVGVTNAPQTVIEKFINETQYDRNGVGFTQDELTLVWSLTVSIFSIGGMLGALLTAVISEKVGRKKGILMNSSTVITASILFGFSKMAKSYEMIIAGRFVVGINAGLNSGLAPMYLTEISPVALRGALGSTYQLVVTMSILLSQVLGLPAVLGDEELWPVLFAIIIAPTMIQLLILSWCPESPKYTLLRKKDDAGCRKALKWLRQTDDVNAEMEAIKSEIEAINRAAKTTCKDLLVKSHLRKPLIISIVMMLSQQFSGINAVISYSTAIFSSAGLNKSMALASTLIMGGINVLMTILSMALVERAGRRTLYIIGLAGLTVITILITVCLSFTKTGAFFAYSSVVLVFLFIVFFASGIGSIPWFIVSELFDQSARGMATSISVTINWVSAFIVTLMFLPLNNLLSHFVFLIFTGLLVIFLIFTIVYVPETKNRTIEEIQATFATARRAPSYRSTQQLTEN